MRKLFSIFAALLVALAVSATSTTLGSDDPKDTHANAISAVISSYDTIYLKAGIYTESGRLAVSNATKVIKAISDTVIIRVTKDNQVTNGAKVTYDGIFFDGSTIGSYRGFTTADASAGKELHFNNCEFYNYPKYVITTNSESCSIDSVVVNNCYFHNNTRGNIYFPKSSTENQETIYGLIVKNSTFANNNASGDWTSIIDVETKASPAENIKVLVDHCTFYNNLTISADHASVRTHSVLNAEVSNCIFAHPTSYERRATYMDANPSYAKYCIAYNFTVDTDHQGHTWMTQRTSCSMDDPKFVDAANGDYTLDEDDSPAKSAGLGGTHLGDPRWWPASWQPAEIIDVTSVALDAEELAIDVNESAFLHATVLPNDATDPSVTWTSSNKAIATVAGGVVKGIAAGTVTITAKAGAKTATCEVTVSDAIPSTDFSEPYFLKGTKAALEGNIYVSEADSLHYEDHSVCGTATWKINALKGAVIAATANYKVGSASGAKLRIVVLDEDENQVGDSLTQEYYEKDGDVTFAGSITLPAAGEYTIKLVNIQSWSSSKLRGITLTDVTPQRLYLKPGIWYWWENEEKFAIYSWADGVGDAWSDYMTLAEDETDIWTGTIPYNHDHVIFVRFGKKSTTPSWSDNMWNKTFDLELVEGKDMYSITSWGEGEGAPCPGEWSKYTHVEKPKFYISGSLTDWASVASYADSYEFDLEAGCYSLKVITLKSKYLGYADLTEEYKAVELYPDEDGNACFTLSTAGKVTVTYIEDNVFKLEGDFVLPPVRLPGITDWDDYPTLTPAENKLTASATVTLAWNYGYSFKVICGNTWLGKAKNGDNNYEVTRSAATVNGLGWEGDNMILRADKAGQYTFTWTYATRELVITYPDLVLEEGFYLVGTFDNEEEWDVASLNAGKKFAFNKEIGEGNNEWKITVPLHTGDRFKAVYIYGDNIASWHPEGSGNDYLVDANHAGASKTIYFQEEYNAEWDGYFYIEQNWPTAIDNSDADIKVEKFFRDGQLIIRKNGVEYNAQGAIVK